MARILLNTFGSFGDLHPYLAVGIELKRRGHTPVIATSEFYRAKVEREALEFAPVRPDIGELSGDQAFLRKLWDERKGTEYLIRDYLIPSVSDAYHDLARACANADLLLTHAAAYAGPIVAEKLQLPWLSIALQPSIFLSVDDPPKLGPAPFLPALRRWGRLPVEIVLYFARLRTSKWAEPIFALRKQLGLRRGGNPFFDELYSPHGTLALFSSQFAQPQPDWPRHTRVCGFPFYDRLGEPQPEMQRLTDFLHNGPPPVLFTLGSSAVLHPGSFYRESLTAVRALGYRAIFLVGPESKELSSGPAVFVASYAPYSAVMPHCSLSVHQGGVGTTAQALRSGRPMIIVPWAHDQPDNAYRVQKLGIGRTIARNKYSAVTLQQELQKLDSLRPRAEQMGETIRKEDGVGTACDAIEAKLKAAACRAQR